ncbi:hypothetical protein OAG00_00795 [Flavobacteriaceae bacterium]|nr:hypothetical protein [Flavobacteriaceae bacterium]
MKYILKTGVLMVTFLIFSCSQEETLTTNPEITADTETVAKLIDGLDKTFKYSQNKGEKVGDLVLSNYFVQSIETYGLEIFKSSTSTKSDQIKHSKEFEKLLLLITDVKSFSSKDDYLNNLNRISLLVNNSQLLAVEKQNLVNKIAFMNSFVNWTESLAVSESNKSNFMAKSDCDGWWSCWGSCVAGTVGSALVGAATLGLTGAAAGTVVLPIIGTVSAGAVGAVVGGIGGALTGAATFC